MRQTLFAAVIAALAMAPVHQAKALVFPGGFADAQFVIGLEGVMLALLLPAVQREREASLRGTITIGNRQVDDPFFPEETLTPGGRAGIFTADILDFDLILGFPTDGEDGSASVRLTPQTGAISIIDRTFFTDGQTLFVDGTGFAPGTPLLDLTVDSFDQQIGFPDGRRLGDDVTDIVLAQLFAGSVNLGVAALPDGFAGAPAIVGVQQLTPGNTFTIGRLAAVADVPAPATAPLLLGGLGILWTRRRQGRTRDVQVG